MSARDRIRAVAETLREPRSVNWISEQADAAWSTTNEELQDLVDQGQLRRVEAGETTRYQPDYTRLLFEEIRTLIEANTREELRSNWPRSPRRSRSGRQPSMSRRGRSSNSRSPTATSTSSDLHERRDVITRWEENLEDRRLIKHALALYSDVEAAREQQINVADRVIN